MKQYEEVSVLEHGDDGAVVSMVMVGIVSVAFVLLNKRFIGGQK